MKGGVTFNDAWGMSPQQRNRIIKFVNKIYKERSEQMTGKKQL